jgi:N-acetylmuramoyl-L-alanine amidase
MRINPEEIKILKEALRKDRSAVIELAKSREGELSNFLMREYYFMSEREVGKSGIQAFQKAVGIKVDGKYGPKTFEAVVNFQAQNGLSVDGIIGKNTLETATGKKAKETQIGESQEEKTYSYSTKALKYLEKNYSPEQIQTLIKLLNGVLPKEEKLKKNATREQIVQATALFQKIHGGLTVDGILGKKTLKALNEDVAA